VAIECWRIKIKRVSEIFKGEKMSMNRAKFETELFQKLDMLSERFVNGLPRKYHAEPALGSLRQFARENAESYQDFSDGLEAAAQFAHCSEQENGMNSPGILWDRVTILVCKRVFTSPTSLHFNALLHKINANINDELNSVLEALHQSKPAKHILLAKEATERQTTAPKIGQSLWELQISNLAMWINQDLLYTIDIDHVDTDRIRSYIRFFSEANKIRNIAIERIEIFYSQKTFRA